MPMDPDMNIPAPPSASRPGGRTAAFDWSLHESAGSAVACRHHVGKMAARSLTVRVAPAIRKRGGREVVVWPDGFVMPIAPRHMATNADPALVKALGRAFRWKRLLDNGTYASVSDIARAAKLDRTYVGDVLRLTQLAPAIVEVIVAGKPSAQISLPCLLKPWPLKWDRQPTGRLSAGCSCVVNEG
jgi:hypothetical protein